MTIASVAEVADGLGVNGGTGSTINTTGADLIVAAVAYYGATDITTSHVSDSKSNTWTAATNYRTSSSYCVRFFYSLSPTVGTSHSITVSKTGSYPAVNFSSWSGVGTYQTVTGATTSSATSIQPGSITPDEDGALLLCMMVHADAFLTPTINSSFTEISNIPYNAGNEMGLEIGYLIQSTAAAVNPTWSWSGNQQVGASMVAFNEPSSGGASAFPWFCGSHL